VPEKSTMKEFSVAELARTIKAGPPNAKSHTLNAIITGVSIDSRTTQPGDCFFAVSGEHLDGHDYLADAFANGAACAVVSKKSNTENPAGDRLLKVNDTRKALGDFAFGYRQQMNFRVVAITGSVGKTTTRQIAYHVLSRHFRVVQAPKNFNNDIGLPLTLLGAGPDDEIVIAELGSNHPGEIAYLTRIAQPDIAVVTNVCPSHLAGFGDLKTIRQEKLSISEGLRKNGILIVNADIITRKSSSEIITFGKSTGCDIQAQHITYDRFASRFTIDGTEISLPLPGRGNVENALAAWAVCSQFGVNIGDFSYALKTVSALPMRAEPLQIGTLTVLNDCYNANPASMKNALEILANTSSSENRRLVFICGDMAELGRQSRQFHAELGASVAQAGVHLLLAVGDFAQVTTRAAKENAEYDLQTKCFEDTASACNNLEKFIKDYDIILVKGSRVAGLEMAVKKLKGLFSQSANQAAR